MVAGARAQSVRTRSAAVSRRRVRVGRSPRPPRGAKPVARDKPCANLNSCQATLRCCFGSLGCISWGWVVSRCCCSPRCAMTRPTTPAAPMASQTTAGAVAPSCRRCHRHRRAEASHCATPISPGCACASLASWAISCRAASADRHANRHVVRSGPRIGRSEIPAGRSELRIGSTFASKAGRAV